MESLGERIAKFLAVEEPEIDWVRPYSVLTHQGNCSGTAGGDGVDEGRGWGGPAITPGDGTADGTGGHRGNDIKAASIEYGGAGLYDGRGTSYTEDLEWGECIHPHLPFEGIISFNGKQVHYLPLMPVKMGGNHLYFAFDVFCDEVLPGHSEEGRVPVIIDSIEDNVARGSVLLDDLTLKPCFIARVGDSFALGNAPGKALDLAAKRHQAAISPKPKPEYTGNDDLPF